jgi:hypothetical protein
MTAPTFFDLAAACIFLAGGVCGWFVRWLYKEGQR